MIKVNFEARDYGYTIISRFERLLRIICHETLISKSHDFRNYIPEGVIQAGQKRLELCNDMPELMENIDFIYLEEIMIYKDN